MRNRSIYLLSESRKQAKSRSLYLLSLTAALVTGGLFLLTG